MSLLQLLGLLLVLYCDGSETPETFCVNRMVLVKGDQGCGQLHQLRVRGSRQMAIRRQDPPGVGTATLTSGGSGPRAVGALCTAASTRPTLTVVAVITAAAPQAERCKKGLGTAQLRAVLLYGMA
jgi:hypothetical protein